MSTTMDSGQQFTLEGAHIELYKLLKLLSLTGSGGEAKQVIDQGLVRVNGEVESRKRRKLVIDDKVLFGEVEITITGKAVSV